METSRNTTGSFGTLIKATATPLSSIFGSGFLIILPILAGTVGRYALPAMAAVCALAYAVGTVIRFNILNAEPLLASQPSEATLSLEHMSDLALVLAYVVSVCLYLHILSSFVFGGIGIDSETSKDILTTGIIVAVTLVGVLKGLKPLSFLERWALYGTLVIIACLLIGFGTSDLVELQSNAKLDFPNWPGHDPWTIVTVVAGTLIVVQGFETSRYLGDVYDAEIRISSSRWSQIVSAIVYLLFIATATPVVHVLGGQYNDNSLIALTRSIMPLMLLPLVLAAVLSQFSAAVADTLAAVGNLEESSHGHLSVRYGYLMVGIGAAALAWTADTLEITALASRAFAFYYMMQCLVAISVSKSVAHRIGFGFVGAVLALIAAFAVPAT